MTRPRSLPAGREGYASVSYAVCDVNTNGTPGTRKRDSKTHASVGVKATVVVRDPAPSAGRVDERSKPKSRPLHLQQWTLILDGAMQQPAPERRPGDDTLVEKRMTAQQRHARVSRACARPEVERRQSAGHGEARYRAP